MKIGTKSVLFGAHQFLIHPIVLAIAWWKLHGFRRVFIGTYGHRDYLEENGGARFVYWHQRDAYTSLWHWKLWLVFIVHDLGYFGKANMDGPEGEEHPVLGAQILQALGGEQSWTWYFFVKYHSRFLAKRDREKPSPLCIADKLALAIEPWWLYLPRVMLTGEAREYSFHKRRDFTETKYNADPFNAEERRLASSDSMVDRVKAMQKFMHRWVEEHKDGREDSWTGAASVSQNS